MALLDRARLTKRFLMALPSGCYIVSNCYTMIAANRHVPAFEGAVGERQQRLVQWERIKAERADGRLCIVYPCKEDYDQFKTGRSN